MIVDILVCYRRRILNNLLYFLLLITNQIRLYKLVAPNDFDNCCSNEQRHRLVPRLVILFGSPVEYFCAKMVSVTKEVNQTSTVTEKGRVLGPIARGRLLRAGVRVPYHIKGDVS